MKIPKLLKYTFIVVGLVILGGLVFSRLHASMQISPQEVNKICSSFFDEVKADTTGVPGYTVVNGAKSCESIEDEMGFEDYRLSVTLRVSKEAMSSETAIKSSMKELSDNIPQRNYPINIYNMLAENGQAAALCVKSFRYIDNDGKDFPQGPPDHTYEYTALDPGESSLCQGV